MTFFTSLEKRRTFGNTEGPILWSSNFWTETLRMFWNQCKCIIILALVNKFRQCVIHTDVKDMFHSPAEGREDLIAQLSHEVTEQIAAARVVKYGYL